MCKTGTQIDSVSPGKRAFLKGFARASAAERKRLLRIEAWFFVVASYVLLLFAYLMPQDYRNGNPTYVGAAWTACMVRTFLFHFGLLLAVIAVVAAWKRMWRLLIAALPLLLVCIGPEVWSLRPRLHEETGGSALRVMSVNLLYINETTQPIIEEIIEADPDVLLLQEYTPTWQAAMLGRIGSRYPHTAHQPADDAFGAAIYSKRPFVERVQPFLHIGSGTEPQFRAVIEHDGRKIALYNVHLLPPFGIDYTIETRSQFADVLRHLEREELPFVLVGDFNFTERTPQAASLREMNVQDAHESAGWGRGTTWPVHGFFRWIPSLRLDHIYLDETLTCTDCRTGTGHGSDHRPVVADVTFAR